MGVATHVRSTHPLGRSNPRVWKHASQALASLPAHSPFRAVTPTNATAPSCPTATPTAGIPPHIPLDIAAQKAINNFLVADFIFIIEPQQQPGNIFQVVTATLQRTLRRVRCDHDDVKAPCCCCRWQFLWNSVKRAIIELTNCTRNAFAQNEQKKMVLGFH